MRHCCRCCCKVQPWAPCPRSVRQLIPNVTGRTIFLAPGGTREQRGYPVVVESNEASHNEADAQKLWQLSEQLTGVQFGHGRFD